MALVGGPPQLFVVHLMKTGGTSLLANVLANVDREQVWGLTDREEDAFRRLRRYTGVDELRALTPEELDRYRVFIGHVPFVAVDLVERPAMVVATVVREPVARTISYLCQCARDFPEHRGRSLEEIYEDPFFGPRTIVNHQTKMLGLSLDQALTRTPPSPWAGGVVERHAMAEALAETGYFDTAQFVNELLDTPIVRAIPVDEHTLRSAKANVERADLVGLHEDLGAFMARVGDRMGWTVDPEVRANVGPRVDVADSFRRRIAEDNALDRELYEHARGLMAVR